MVSKWNPSPTFNYWMSLWNTESNAAAVVDIYYSSHPNIRLNSSGGKGMGLFAIAPIEEGEIIWSADPITHPTGKVWTLDNLDQDLDWWWHWAYRCGENECFGPIRREDVDNEATYYQNHSCDPTTWWINPFTLVARKKINEGEEITYDYATSECDDYELALLDCECGTNLCRKKLSGNDFMLPELVERYGQHFQPYLIKRQQELGLRDPN